MGSDLESGWMGGDLEPMTSYTMCIRLVVCLQRGIHLRARRRDEASVRQPSAFVREYVLVAWSNSRP